MAGIWRNRKAWLVAIATAFAAALSAGLIAYAQVNEVVDDSQVENESPASPAAAGDSTWISAEEAQATWDLVGVYNSTTGTKASPVPDEDEPPEGYTWAEGWYTDPNCTPESKWDPERIVSPADIDENGELHFYKKLIPLDADNQENKRERLY